jgi:hypothetical protein
VEDDVRGFENSRLASEWDPNFPDENTPYYVKRLNEVSEKFAPFLSPRDYQRIFSLDDLFSFSADGIALLTVPTETEAPPGEEETDESKPPEPTIWLDEESL